MTSVNIARNVCFTTMAAAAVALPALAGHADPRLIQLCLNGHGVFCVYDPQNNPVGTTTGGVQGDEFSILERPLNGTVYRVLYDLSQGFVLPAFLTDVFFTAPNCPAAGPAYVLANPLGDPPVQVPQFLAQYDPDLKVLWGATSATIQKNVAYTSRLFNGSCTNGTGTIPDVLPAKVVDPTPPAGPFSIR